MCDHCFAELRKRGKFLLVRLPASSCPVLVVTDPSCREQCARAVQQLQPADSPCQPPSLGCLPESATTQFVEEQEEQLVSQPGEPHLLRKPVKRDPTVTVTCFHAVIVY